MLYNLCKNANFHLVFWQIIQALRKVISKVELIQPQVIPITIIWLIVIQQGITYTEVSMGFSNLVLLQRHGHLRVHDPAAILLVIPRDIHL